MDSCTNGKADSPKDVKVETLWLAIVDCLDKRKEQNAQAEAIHETWLYVAHCVDRLFCFLLSVIVFWVVLVISPVM